MADEKTEAVTPGEVVAPVPPVEAPPKSEAELLTKPVVPPADDLGATIDQFFTGVQFAGLVSLKAMLEQLKKKADAVITKLDVPAHDDTPKKQG